MRIGEHECFIRIAKALPGVAIGSNLSGFAGHSFLYKWPSPFERLHSFRSSSFNIIAGAMAIPSDLKEAADAVRIAG